MKPGTSPTGRHWSMKMEKVIMKGGETAGNYPEVLLNKPEDIPGKNPKGERRDPEDLPGCEPHTMKARSGSRMPNFGVETGGMEPEDLPGMGEDEIFCRKKGSRDPGDTDAADLPGLDPDQTRDPGTIRPLNKTYTGSLMGDIQTVRQSRENVGMSTETV